MFGCGRRDVAERPHQPAIVEPVDPFEGSQLDSLEGAPWSTTMNQLCLVKTINGLGQRVVIRITDTADRWLDPCCRQSLCVLNGNVLTTPVGMMDESIASSGPALMQCLLESIENKPGMGSAA